MTETNYTDEKFIRMALALARRGRNKVEPNPLVGAVIVKDNRIISHGWHRFFGGPHAEADAIKKLMSKYPRRWRRIIRGASLYVNLEPCCHNTKGKKTPPCVPLIIDSGVKKVVVGMVDPNPLVSGRGLAMLRKAGIKTVSGILEEDCRELNKVYVKNISSRMPYVILKTAMTLDGKIASPLGDSKWITSDISRDYVHRLRSTTDGILVGVRTIIKDNPLLTSHGKGADPVKIIIDPEGETPFDAKIFNSPRSRVIIVTTPSGEEHLRNKKFAAATDIISVKSSSGFADGKVMDFRRIMKEIFTKFGIRSILIEGGGFTSWQAVKSGVVDEYLFFIAPRILGGEKSITPVEGEGYSRIKLSQKVKIKKVFRLGEDVVISAVAVR